MSRPRIKRNLLSATLACGLLLAGCTATGDTKTTITVADSYPPGHPFSTAGAQVFMDTVEELTNGDVKFEYYPAEQMGKAADIPTLVRTGVVDMGAVAPGYVESQLPLSGAADLPGLVDNACSGSHAVNKLMSPGNVLYEEEFGPRGVRPLVVGMVPDYEVLTKDVEVTKPSDVAGLQLRSSGGTIDRMVSALQASPVSMPAPEMYQAISRGTVDGTVLGGVSAAPYHVEEVTGFATEGARLGSFTLTYSIREKAWEELTPAEQEVFRQAGDKATDSVCKAIQEGNDAARKKLADAGVKVHRITDGNREAWDAISRPVQDGWAHDMEQISKPGGAAIEAMKAQLVKEASDGS